MNVEDEEEEWLDELACQEILQYAKEERAAIHEYEAGMTREAAEKLAGVSE